MIKEEVEKLLKVKFLKVVDDTQWSTNIVPILKKDGRIKMYLDYRNLNKACSKDDFLLSYIDILVDSAVSSAYTLSWMGFWGTIKL